MQAHINAEGTFTGAAGESRQAQMTLKGALKVQDGGWSFTNITLAAPTTTAVKSGAGVFHGLVINKPVASAVITIYDNTAASGTVIGTITLPATLLAEGPIQALYDVQFGTGLTITTATGACDITVMYR